MSSILTDVLVPAAAQEMTAKYSTQNNTAAAATTKNTVADTDENVAVQVSLSADARDLLTQENAVAATAEDESTDNDAPSSGGSAGTLSLSASAAAGSGSAGSATSSLEEQTIERLKENDEKIRKKAEKDFDKAGDDAVGIQYAYITGPDDNLYVVGYSIATKQDFSSGESDRDSSSGDAGASERGHTAGVATDRNEGEEPGENGPAGVNSGKDGVDQDIALAYYPEEEKENGQIVDTEV